MGNTPGNIMVPITMFGWIPVVMMLFSKLEARLAVTIAFIAGWMFLPVAAFNLPGLPDYTKTTATCVGIFAGAWLYDRQRLKTFRFSAADIPMLLWCTAPFFSSITNGLGPYDGLSQAMYQTIRWGMPYFIARIYFTDFPSMKLLAMSVFIGGIVYIPFCWFELIMSPQLHRLTYGFHQHNFLQTLRDGGGFRPMVYMDHGLMTSMWMVLAIFMGSWLLYIGELPKKILAFPSVHLLIFLVVTTVMMQSIGALVLLMIGMLVLYLSSRLKFVWLVWVMLVIPHAYIITRTTGYWDGRNLSGFVAEKFSPKRAQSLQFRFDNETILVDKALQGTFFGWGGFGRSRVYDDKGRDISITDGQWIITLGTTGIYGLAAMAAAIQFPVVLFLRRTRPELWNTKEWASPAIMAVFLCLYMIDCLLNAMINPVYMLFMGGLTGIMLKKPELLARTSMNPDKAGSNIQCRNLPGTRFITQPQLPESRFVS